MFHFGFGNHLGLRHVGIVLAVEVLVTMCRHFPLLGGLWSQVLRSLEPHFVLEVAAPKLVRLCEQLELLPSISEEVRSF